MDAALLDGGHLKGKLAGCRLAHSSANREQQAGAHLYVIAGMTAPEA